MDSKNIMKNIIDIQNVSVAYEDTCILKKVNLHIDEGEFVSFVGKSGIGKTTLLNAICGFIPYEGKIIAPQDKGIVFQNYALFPWMTVANNIAFGLNKMHKEKKKQVVDYYLYMANLKKHAHKYPAELSGGQIQKVALVRAFAPQPSVILMDEPYSALDIHTRDTMQQWLLDVWEREKKTILLVTHYLDEAIFLSDKIFILTKGKIKEIKIDFPRPRKEA